jgi:hypothetical protein
MTTAEPLRWSLNTLQKWFVSVTTHPESVQAGIEVHSDIVSAPELARVLRPNSEESLLDRLAIYHHGYFARLEECLADDYPALKFALGGEAFSDICHWYVNAHPTSEPNLNGYGRAMPDFIRGLDLDTVTFLPELTRLEWACVEVLHAAAPEPMSAQALLSMPAEALPSVRFKASDALRLFAFEYPVNAYLQAFYEDRKPSIPVPEVSSVAVVRSNYTIWRFDLNSVQFALLSRLARGVALGTALDGINASAVEVRDWFSEWTKYGLFTGVQSDGS